MKKIAVLICLCCHFSIVIAQKKQNVYFYKNSGKEVGTKDSADYVRVILEPDSGESNFVLQEYHLNGKRKAVGKLSAFEPRLIYEGVIVKFDTLGKRKEITTYERGIAIGMSYQYFGNGKLHKQTEYLPYIPLPIAISFPGTTGSIFNPNSKLIYYADSLGKVYIEAGNGHFMETVKTSSGERSEEGMYKEGVRDGVWKGSDTSPASSFTETYEMGKFIGGERIIENLKYPYANKETPPEFKGGIKKFYDYVGNTIRYPVEAARAKIEGRVIVEFTVEKDGSIGEVGIKQSAHSSLDEEAKRVIKFSPKWIPASIRGLPVRVRYSIPLNFKLPVRMD